MCVERSYWPAVIQCRWYAVVERPWRGLLHGGRWEVQSESDSIGPDSGIGGLGEHGGKSSCYSV